MPKANDYLGILIFALLLTLVVYLAFAIQTRQTEIINKLNLRGASYLSPEQYLAFAKLENVEEFDKLNVSLIKDRLEKHPYVRKADVKLDEKGNAEINITEKKIDAFLNCGSRQYLVSDKYEALPLLSFTRKLNVPVISNPDDCENIKNYKNLLKINDVKTAFKLMETVKVLNKDLLRNVSEIDLREGKDIVVYLSGINYPVVLGRENEVRKMIYFSKFWNKLKGKEINQVVDYIDLRFDKHLYIGFTGAFDEENGV